MNPSLRFVGENPSDAEVQVEKSYLKFETDNLQYFNTDGAGLVQTGKLHKNVFTTKNSRPRDKASQSLCLSISLNY